MSPILIGVLNLSPESMVEDSVVRTPEALLARAGWLAGLGVEILDLGGRSITPDAPKVDDATEQARLEPAVALLKRDGYRVSVDTWSPTTARQAISWGADVINYTGEEVPDALLAAAASARTTLILTYMPYGDAYQMRERPRVAYVISAIEDFLAPRIARARDAGVSEIVIDPNLGILHPDTDDYQKIHLQYEVLDQVERLRELGCPIMLYAPRKPERLARITMASAVLRAGPDYLRTHDPDTIQHLLQAADQSASE